MRFQVLLTMGQDCLSKEEVGGLLEQRFHVVTTSQDFLHSTKNFVKLARYYLGEEIMFCQYMTTWPRHIYRFKRQYKKAFEKDPLFGADLVNSIRKQVQVFLHS